MPNKRLIVVSQVSEDLLSALNICTHENERVSNFCCFLSRASSQSWKGVFQDQTFEFENINDSGPLLDSLMSLEVKRQFADENITEDLNILFITDGSNPSGTLFSNFCDVLIRTGHSTNNPDIFVLNIEKGNLKVDLDVRAIFEVKQLTKSGVANYSDADWAALIVQLAEFLIVSPSSRFDRVNQKYSLGYVGVGINTQEGMRYLSAKSLKWLIERELTPVDLNTILGYVNPVVRKYRDRFEEIIKQQIHPECDDLFEGVNRDNISTVEALLKYESRLKDSQVTSEIETQLQSLVDEIRLELINTVNSLKSIRERHAFVQALSGAFPEVATGKPLRDWETVYELYTAPLNSLKALGVELSELEQTQIMHEALNEAQDINLEISDTESEISRHLQLNRPTNDLESRLQALKNKLDSIRATSAEAAEKCRSIFKQIFGQVDKDLIRRNADQIIKDAQYTLPQAPTPLEPVFSRRIVLWMIFTILPTLIWTLLDYKLFKYGGIWSLGTAAVVIFVWIVIIAKRLSREQPEVLNVDNEMRNKFRDGCNRLAELYLTTASLRNFNRFMEEQVQFFIEIETMDLGLLVPIFQQEHKKACLTIESAFIDKSNEIILSDKDSFEKYFNEVFSNEVPNIPYVLKEQSRLEQFRPPVREISKVAQNFFNQAKQWSDDRSSDLMRFALFRHMLTRDGVKPLFLNKELPDLESIMAKCVSNLVTLHTNVAPDEAQIYIFRYENDSEKPLVDNFDKQADRYFPESRTGNLQKIGSKSTSRIGFLKLQSIDSRDFVLESTKDFFRKLGDSSDFRIRWVEEIGDDDYSNENDYSNELININDDNFIVYYLDNEVESKRASQTLEYANQAIPELINFFGKYGYAKDANRRKVPVYLASSAEHYQELIKEMCSDSAPPIQNSVGLCLTTISSDGSKKCEAILINYQVRATDDVSMEEDVNITDLKTVLFHEMAHYNHYFCMDLTRKSKYFNWELEGVAVYFAQDWNRKIPTDAQLKNINLVHDATDYKNSYWMGYHAFYLLNQKNLLEKILKLSYDAEIIQCIEEITSEPIDIFVDAWRSHCENEIQV
jgi:hypothetical protein